MKRSEIIKIDRENIWHPFTQMKDYENSEHVVITRGKGVKLFDIDNNYYYDTVSSWWTNVFGHGNKHISHNIRSQLNSLEHVIFAGITHPYAAKLVDLMNRFLPSELSKYFFSDNGSTSVEVALKMAFQYWQNLGKTSKTKFIFFENSYHGDTIGAVSVGGIDLYHKLYKPLMFNSHQVKSPICRQCIFRKNRFTLNGDTGCNCECIDEVERLIEDRSEEIAAVIIEPMIQCAAGMNIYNGIFLKKLRDLCTQNDIILIFDEVATGFGRTGKMFAFEHVGIIPDILCLSKGITGGFLPLALTVTTKTIYDAFYDDYFSYKTFFHGHSYTANPIACSAAVGCLENFIKKPIEKYKSGMEKLKDAAIMMSEFDFVSDVRNIGFIAAFDIINPYSGKPFPAKERVGLKIYHESLKNNLILRPLGDTIYWMLPVNIRKIDIEQIYNKTVKSIKNVIEGYSWLRS
ncbi:MAG: adenosylmethionine--8-amino-7-oxononanoate transaminase [Calditerrivibrio sp.]|nr:adenosylmethionine--8-amino-7-oxononanoate transaminase [Calditerrivibrio sp.]